MNVDDRYLAHIHSELEAAKSHRNALLILLGLVLIILAVK